jgi:hypothetical protein
MPSPNIPPTYGVGYTQAEQNANATTICGYIDNNLTADTAIKAALLAWFTAAQNALLDSIRAHGDNTNVGPVKVAFTNLVTALS